MNYEAMASQYHTGKKCLRLGASAIGSKIVKINGKVFDNEAQRILKQCPETGFMLTQIEQHLLERYPKVFDGTLDKIECVPELYDYGVETKNNKKALAMQYGIETEINARIEELKGIKKFEDEKELKFFKDVLLEKMSKACEEKANYRFLDFFKNEPGLFLHGFKPREYLKRFRELAKEERKTMSTLKLLDVEHCILDLLQINEQEIEDWIKEKVELIKTKNEQDPKSISSKLFSSDVILDSLEWTSTEFPPKDRKQQLNKFKTTFPKFKKTNQNGKYYFEVDAKGTRIEQFYTMTEIKRRLLESEFDYLTNFDDEYDIIFFHLNEKLIMAGEVKQAMPNAKDQIVANDNQAESASHQLRKSERFIHKTFGHLLDSGWRYVKIAILYDNQGSYTTNQCSECSPFILTNGTKEEEKQQMQDLWKAITGKEYKGPPKQPNASGMADLKHVFARLIGLSGFTFIVQKIGKYHELMGTKPHDIFDDGITAGWTRAAPLTFGNEETEIRFGDVVGRPSDIYRLIFWNPAQRHLLEGKHRFVLFCHDYGAGKRKTLH